MSKVSDKHDAICGHWHRSVDNDGYEYRLTGYAGGGSWCAEVRDQQSKTPCGIALRRRQDLLWMSDDFSRYPGRFVLM